MTSLACVLTTIQPPYRMGAPAGRHRSPRWARRWSSPATRPAHGGATSTTTAASMSIQTQRASRLEARAQGARRAPLRAQEPGLPRGDRDRRRVPVRDRRRHLPQRGLAPARIAHRGAGSARGRLGQRLPPVHRHADLAARPAARRHPRPRSRAARRGRARPDPAGADRRQHRRRRHLAPDLERRHRLRRERRFRSSCRAAPGARSTARARGGGRRPIP